MEIVNISQIFHFGRFPCLNTKFQKKEEKTVDLHLPKYS